MFFSNSIVDRFRFLPHIPIKLTENKITIVKQMREPILGLNTVNKRRSETKKSDE